MLRKCLFTLAGLAGLTVSVVDATSAEFPTSWDLTEGKHTLSEHPTYSFLSACTIRGARQVDQGLLLAAWIAGSERVLHGRERNGLRAAQWREEEEIDAELPAGDQGSVLAD
jgi:hypothetical protein